MKKILITGKHSYIGDSFAKWLEQWPDDYNVTKWDFKDDSWRERDFSQFDSVFNVAGIAHNSSDKKLEDLYYKVNRDLAIEIAEKAKRDGVKQYIHMSSIIVYGSKVNKITAKTPFNPDNFYGDSKVQAELGLNKIADENFKVAIIRPPMIYGENSKGNFPKLAEVAKKTPIFPNYRNSRSVLYIDNLCELVRLIVKTNEMGIFYPQMSELVSTSEIVERVSFYTDHKIKFIKLFNPMISALKNIELINKIFGDLYYDSSLSKNNLNYQILDFNESINKIFSRGEE